MGERQHTPQRFDLTEVFPIEDVTTRGHGPCRFTYDRTCLEQVSADIATLLDIPDTSEIVISYKRYVDDAGTLAYIINSLPTHLFSAAQQEDIFLAPDQLHHLFQYLTETLGYSLGSHKACLNAHLGSELDYPFAVETPDMPFMRLSEVGVAASGVPLWHSDVWIAQNVLEFTVTRSR